MWLAGRSVFPEAVFCHGFLFFGYCRRFLSSFYLSNCKTRISAWYQHSCVSLIRTKKTKAVTSLKFGPNLSNGTSIFTIYVYRVSQEERTKFREGVPYVKVYRYNPKHLYPKLNGYGDNGKRSLKL